MNDINNGGPAFPSTLQYFPDDTSYHDHEGMSLRDYFAANALQGMLAENGGGAVDNDALAKFAYKIADAMLEARK